MVKLRLAAVAAIAAIAAIAIGAGALGACGHKAPSSSVPTLAASNGARGPGSGASADAGRALNGTTGDASAARRAALHNAADCIRQHGAPNYQDPVLTPDGRVYTDERTLHDAVDEAGATAIENACGDLIRAAKFSPDDQAPPPPRLIQAGVRSAQCLREHGLPDYKDPTVNSRFTPGHGFGMDPGSIPAGGKQDPTVQRALQACRSILDEEARLSSLGSLANA
jgi:hypothetical protein